MSGSARQNHRCDEGNFGRLGNQMSWNALLKPNALVSVIPAEYACFAEPVAAALCCFLEGLPFAEQKAILSDQATLPPTADISQRLGRLARCCPVLHKLGQVLARDQRLAPELRAQLCALESLPASVPLEQIEALLQQELGALDGRGVTLQPPAIAEASVAVVIPYLDHAHAGAKRRGVFKLLKPGIEDRLELELTLLERVGQHLDERCDELGIPALDYEESFQQVRQKLLDEVRLGNEQQHMRQARCFYQDDPSVQIPEVFGHCTPRVTAMEFLEGGKVTDHRLESPRDRRRLAHKALKALITKPIFSPDSAALFHGDPHPGNLFLTTDHRVGILDWSLVGRLRQNERERIVEMILAAVTLDSERLFRLLVDMSQHTRLNHATARQLACEWIQKVRRGQWPGLGWLLGLLDEAVQTARLRVDADLMLFRKSLYTLEGVVSGIGVDQRCRDDVLCSEFLRHLAAEWPRRWFTQPSSRTFATGLSNLDLAATWLSLPLAATRYWSETACDIWNPAVLPENS